MSIHDCQKEIQTFLGSHKAFALTTSDVDGEVFCAPLYYAEDGFLRLLFVSDEDSRHCQNLMQNPNVAGSVYEEGETIVEICGLQFMGLAQKVLGKAFEDRAIYLEKFPELKDSGMYERFEKSSLYEVKVTWMRWISMSEGKPNRVEGLI